MKKLVLFVLPFAMLFLFVALPVVQAQSEEEVVAKDSRQELAAQELVATTPLVALCWTCGGSYPVWAGSFETGPVGPWANELGSSCSGGFAWRIDRYPRLCTR